MLPELLPAAAELTAALGDDGVGVVDSPAHSGLLHAEPDDSLAASFDYAGTAACPHAKIKANIEFFPLSGP